MHTSTRRPRTVHCATRSNKQRYEQEVSQHQKDKAALSESLRVLEEASLKQADAHHTERAELAAQVSDLQLTVERMTQEHKVMRSYDA